LAREKKSKFLHPQSGAHPQSAAGSQSAAGPQSGAHPQSLRAGYSRPAGSVRHEKVRKFMAIGPSQGENF